MAYEPQVITDALAMEAIALAVARNNVGQQAPIQTVLAQEYITQAAYDQLLKDPLFNNLVLQYETELIDKGFSFMAKNKVAAEDGLKDMYKLLKDDDTPAAVKVKIYENFVNNAGLAPKAIANAGDGTPGITINIVAPQGYTPSIADNPSRSARAPVTITQTQAHTTAELIDPDYAD